MWQKNEQMQRTLRAGWHNVNSNPPKNKKRHLAGWLALCQPYQVKPIRHKTLTNVTLQAGRYDVNHCCHINSKPPTKNEKMQRTLRAGWHNHCCQESCHPPLPPTHPARKSDEKIGLDSDENLFLWKKLLWKVLFNPKRILILQKLQTFLPWQIGICINGHVTLCFFQKGLAKKAGLKLNSDNKSAKSISFWWQFWGMTFFEDVTRGRAVCQRKQRCFCFNLLSGALITFGCLRKYFS